jgi:hypothetical protein
MNHRMILKAAAVVGLVFGIGLVFAPNSLMNMYRAETLVGTGVYNAMLLGGVLLGIAVMNWAASEAPEIAEIHYVLIGNLVANGACFLIALYRQLTSATAVPASWLNVAIFLVLGALFGYLYMSSPAGYKLHAHATPA